MMEKIKSRLLASHVYPLFCIAMLSFLVFMYGINRPNYNWDGIGYVAALYKSDAGNNPVAIHDLTFAEVRAGVTPDKWITLTHSSPYVSEVFHSPNSLYQQIPFYEIRPAYLGLVKVFSNFGLGYLKSTYWVSAVFAALSTLLFCQFFRVGSSLAWVFAAILISMNFKMGRYSTPDAMANFLYCLAQLLI